DVQRGGPELDGICARVDRVAVRLEAAVGEARDAVLAFHDDVGFFETLVCVARELFAGRFASGSDFSQVVFLHQVRENFVVDLDLANRIGGLFFRYRVGGGDFGAGPLGFGYGLGHDLDSGDTRHLARLLHVRRDTRR